MICRFECEANGDRTSLRQHLGKLEGVQGVEQAGANTQGQWKDERQWHSHPEWYSEREEQAERP